MLDDHDGMFAAILGVAVKLLVVLAVFCPLCLLARCAQRARNQRADAELLTQLKGRWTQSRP